MAECESFLPNGQFCSAEKNIKRIKNRQTAEISLFLGF